MKLYKAGLVLLTCGLLAACSKTARSISHSGYRAGSPHCGVGNAADGSDAAFEYRGELSEFDVLGVTRGEITSQAEIQRTLADSKPVKLRPGSSVLLIQSGALFPDAPMVAELSRYFDVVPFSGVSGIRRTVTGVVQTESADPETFSKSLRLIAARGGADAIICYWGMLESENDRLATKTISWVPFVNWAVPDEKHHMRIRLKIALMDVRSGNWSVFSPKAFEDARLTTAPRRGAVDQKQVERLKKLAYSAGVAELVQPGSGRMSRQKRCCVQMRSAVVR